jgi:hypothetical protein
MKYIIALLFSIPSLAFNTIEPHDGTAWELNVMAGSQVFGTILEAMTQFVNSGSFSTLATLVALVGFFTLMIGSVGGLDGKKIGMFFLGIVAVSITTFKIDIDILVMDGAATSGYSQFRLVENVPLSVGFPAVAINQIGGAFARQIEVFFSPVNADLNYTNTRTLNMQGQILKDILDSRIFSAELDASLAEFYVQCVFPSIESGKITVTEIMQSPDVFQSIGGRIPTNGAVRNYTISDVNQQIQSCPVAFNSLSDLIVFSSSAFNMKPYSSDTSKMSGAGFNATIGELGNSVLSSFSGNTNTSTSAMVMNKSVLAAFNNGLKVEGTRVGRGDLIEALTIEQAVEQQLSGWKMAAEIFNTTVGYLAVVLHAFILGISPIILVMFFVPGIAGKIIVSYFQILVWLALWDPMLTIVNYIIVSFQANTIQFEVGEVLLNNSAQLTSSSAVFTTINTAIEKFQIVGGFLGASVPMIAWGLVKGGMAFSQFLSSGLGGSIAAGAAKNLASGALSHDVSSFNNSSGNKQNNKFQNDTGYGVSTVSSLNGDSVAQNSDTGTASSSINGVAATSKTSTSQSDSTSQILTKAANATTTVSDAIVSQAQSQVTQLYTDMNAEGASFGKDGSIQTSKSGSTLQARANKLNEDFNTDVSVGGNRRVETSTARNAADLLSYKLGDEINGKSAANWYAENPNHADTKAFFDNKDNEKLERDLGHEKGGLLQMLVDGKENINKFGEDAHKHFATDDGNSIVTQLSADIMSKVGLGAAIPTSIKSAKSTLSEDMQYKTGKKNSEGEDTSTTEQTAEITAHNNALNKKYLNSFQDSWVTSEGGSNGITTSEQAVEATGKVETIMNGWNSTYMASQSNEQSIPVTNEVLEQNNQKIMELGKLAEGLDGVNNPESTNIASNKSNLINTDELNQSAAPIRNKNEQTVLAFKDKKQDDEEEASDKYIAGESKGQRVISAQSESTRDKVGEMTDNHVEQLINISAQTTSMAENEEFVTANRTRGYAEASLMNMTNTSDTTYLKGLSDSETDIKLNGKDGETRFTPQGNNVMIGKLEHVGVETYVPNGYLQGKDSEGEFFEHMSYTNDEGQTFAMNNEGKLERYEFHDEASKINEGREGDEKIRDIGSRYSPTQKEPTPEYQDSIPEATITDKKE